MKRISKGDVEAGTAEGGEGISLLLSAPAPLPNHTALTTENRGKSDPAATQEDLIAYEDLRTLGLLATEDPDDTEESNRLRPLVDTRLHRAVEAGDLAEIRRLVDAGASLASLDLAGRTPLHLCIHEKLLEPFQVLLSYEGSVDAKDASGWPVLSTALMQRWPDGVRAALAAGADVTEASPERTPIHIAVSLREIGLLNEILIIAEQKGVVDCLDKSGKTALASAIYCHDLEAVKTLLMRGASANCVSVDNTTALHIAIKDYDILKYILDNTDVSSSYDNNGRAPVHNAVLWNNPKSVKLLLEKFGNLKTVAKAENGGLTALHLAAKLRCNKVAEVILHHLEEYEDEEIHQLDNSGDTALHTAAQAGNRSLTVKLLRSDGVLSARGHDGKTVIEMIAHTSNSIKFFELIFDEFIIGGGPRTDIGDSCVTIDYKVLTKKDTSQINVIEEFIRCGQSRILVHPLIESLLYLKWRDVLPVFCAMIVTYMTFLITFNFFVVHEFYYADNNSSLHISVTNSSKVGKRLFELYDGWYWLLVTAIYTTISLMLVQELLCIYFERLRYFAHVESWVKLCVLFLGVVVPVGLSIAQPAGWLRHAACAALLLAGLQAMFMLARFPDWGNYIPMFGKVACSLLKILGTVILLVIAFSFCFMIQYQSAPPFDGPFSAFVKTLVMMTSEFDYTDMFGNDYEQELQKTRTVVRLLFVVFMIFVAIVLMNFMIGVAVSDINDLNTTGNIRRLEKQVELLSFMDKVVYDVFNGVISKIFKMHDQKHFLYLTCNNEEDSQQWRVKYENSLTDKRKFYSIKLSFRLRKAILDLARNNQELLKESKEKRTYSDMMDALYSAVVGKPLDSDEEVEKDDNEQRDEKQGNGSYSLREVISKQNEQIKSLADDLLQVTHNNEQIKRSNEDLSSKINQVTSDIASLKDLITSDNRSLKELKSDITAIKDMIALNCSQKA